MKSPILSLLLLAAVACARPKAEAVAAVNEPVATAAVADVEYQQADSLEVVSLLADSAKQTTLDFARHFMGRPYVAYTLDGYYKAGARPDAEHLVVNLREFDCLTFLETCNALAMTRAQLSTTPGLNVWDAYCSNLQTLRYFGGVEDGYLSRIHYLSMSIADHLERGTMQEVELPEKTTRPRTTVINYMTQHPSSYFALKNNPDLVAPLAELEQRYSNQSMRYLPQDNCGLPQQQLKAIHDGDILYIVTSKDGLDYSHQGFAFWGKDGRLHMLHASSAKKQVIADPLTLEAYLKGISTNIGVRVFRLKY